MKTILAALLLLLICSCSERESWEPSGATAARGEEVGRSYATSQLGLSEAELEKMKADFFGLLEDGKRILVISFYDPAFHQPSEFGLDLVWGGFPAYFTISVDVHTWTVVDHYASTE